MSGYINSLAKEATEDRIPGYVDRLGKEATKIHPNKNNFNLDCGFILSHAWSVTYNQHVNPLKTKLICFI
jgi:hypothetical protein